MSTILVRDLDEVVHARLKHRAARHGRSMEAEVRVLLADAVADEADGWWAAWGQAASQFRDLGFELPARSLPREVNFE